jgi:Uma2 family endonuclease
MSTARRLHHGYDDYLAIEAYSELRHEYLDGEIYAMAGGTPEHGALTARMTIVVGNLLSRCTPLTSDVRVRIEATGLTTYPDASFVCGPAQRSAIDRLAVTNPAILVEVTSPSTEDYDRGDKLSHYRQISSVQVVLIVSHAAPRITVVERDGDAWRTTDVRAGERVDLRAFAASFAVDDVYAVLPALSADG